VGADEKCGCTPTAASTSSGCAAAKATAARDEARS
jgi:hypothetical protein